MRKVFKILGVIVITLTGVVICLGLILWGIISYGSYSRKKEAERYQREVCDTINVVHADFNLRMRGFEKDKNTLMKSYLIRNGLVVGSNSYRIGRTDSLQFPFKSFFKKDSILIIIGKKSFTLSGVNYKADYPHWGMFGPVGHCECMRTGIFETMNGKTASQYENYLVLDKKEAEMVNPTIPAHLN